MAEYVSIELVCLDMAGTVVRDDGAVAAAFEAALTGAGLEPGTPEHAKAMDFAHRTMGWSKIEVFRSVFADEARAAEANDAFERAYARGLGEHGVEPIQGASQAVGEMREAGIKVALTTGFSPETRDALLDRIGWTSRCDLALSPSDAGRGRPYPDMLLTALIRLRLNDVRSIAAVGDTTNDLIAGTRAGASLVAGVLTGAHGEAELATAPHTHLLGSVAELPAAITAHNRRT